MRLLWTSMSAAELCRCLDAMPEAKRLKLIPANIVLTDWIPHEACLDEFAAIERKDGELVGMELVPAVALGEKQDNEWGAGR